MKAWEQALAGLDRLISADNGKSKDEVGAEESKAQTMEDIELANTNIFAQEDFVLYRAVVRFYLRQYSKALTDFQDAYSLMSSSKTYIKDSEEDPNAEQSVDSELSDIGLCTLNKYEYTYNSMLCLLMSGDLEKALVLANNVIDNAGIDYVNKMWLIRGAILQTLGKKEEGTMTTIKRG